MINFPYISKDVQSKDILDYCTSYGEVSAFKKDATNAKVKFATGDAVAFVQQNQNCLISGKNCKPIVYKFETLFMTEAEIVR